MIDRLEHAGYITRERSAEDRRKVTVTLNNDRLDSEDAPRLQRLKTLLADYDRAQLDTIADFLTRLADIETNAVGSPPNAAQADR